jgi:Fe2+ transport system protein FeoA
VSNSDSSALKSPEDVHGMEAARPGSMPDRTGRGLDVSAAIGRSSAHTTLDALEPGRRGRVVWIDPSRQAELVQHGLIEDAVVRLESRAPFGGPVVLGIGSARLAIGRGLARAIRVEPIA